GGGGGGGGGGGAAGGGGVPGGTGHVRVLGGSREPPARPRPVSARGQRMAHRAPGSLSPASFRSPAAEVPLLLAPAGTNDQARSGLRYMVTTAAPPSPRVCCRATLASFTWRFSAWPRSCQLSSAHCARPVAPSGWPFEMRPPDGFTTHLPP